MPGTADDAPIPSLLRASRGAYRHATEHNRLGTIRLVEDEWEPTELGRRAAAAVASAIRDVEARLTERIGVDGINALRRGLVALCDIRDGYEPSA